MRMWLVKNWEDSVKIFENTAIGTRCLPIVHNEVAIVYTGEDPFPELNRELCLYSRNSSLKLISNIKKRTGSSLLSASLSGRYPWL